MYERVSCSCTDIVSLDCSVVLSRFSRSSEQTNDPSMRIVRRRSRSCFMYNVEPEESRHDPSRKRARRFEAPSFRSFVSILNAENETHADASRSTDAPSDRKISLRVHVRFSFHRAKNRSRNNIAEASNRRFVCSQKRFDPSSGLVFSAPPSRHCSLHALLTTLQFVLNSFFYVSFHSLVYFQNTTS